MQTPIRTDGPTKCRPWSGEIHTPNILAAEKSTHMYQASFGMVLIVTIRDVNVVFLPTQLRDGRYSSSASKKSQDPPQKSPAQNRALTRPNEGKMPANSPVSRPMSWKGGFGGGALDAPQLPQGHNSPTLLRVARYNL